MTNPPADLFDNLIVPMPVVTLTLAAVPSPLLEEGPLLKLWRADPTSKHAHSSTRTYHVGFDLRPKEPVAVSYQLTTLLAHPEELPA